MAPSYGYVLQNSFYIGLNLENILYGIELLLYFKTIQIFLIRRKHARRNSDLFYAIFSTVMVIMVTIYVATQSMFGEEMWIVQSGYSGGAYAYWNNHIADWYLDWGTTSVVILQLMTDGLMIHRCRILWNSYRVIIIPAILWLCTIALGILTDWSSSLPGSNFFTGLASDLALSYYSVSVFLNATLTCMICYYMMWNGRQVEKGLGREYASMYFTVFTIVVESVVPYTLSGIAFLVSMGVGSATSVTFVSVYVLMMCVSPQMLILRVLTGTALSRPGVSEGPDTSVKFKAGQISDSQWFEGATATSGGETTSVPLQVLSNVYVPGARNGKVVISQV